MGCSDWPQELANKFLPFLDLKNIWHLDPKEMYLLNSNIRVLCLEMVGTWQRRPDNATNIPTNDEQQGRTVTSHEGLSAQPTVQSSCEHEVDIRNRRNSTHRRKMVTKGQGEGYNHQHLQTFHKIHFHVENATKIA